MATRNFSSTAAQTTLSSSVDGSTTTLTVSATTGFPSVPFILAVDAGAAGQELVLVTNVAGTTLTVTRGYDSTIAVNHDTGAVVAHSHGAIDFREANAHVNATAGAHGASGAVQGLNDVKALLLAAHPVGDIKMTTVNVNPSTYLGGAWVAWGSGRVPVGVDAAQSEFNTVEETGGAKTHTLTTAEMPSHTHTQDPHSHGATNSNGSGVASVGGNSTVVAAGTSVFAVTQPVGNAVIGSTTATNQSTGGGGAHNNLQPYITCYMFKRTA